MLRHHDSLAGGEPPLVAEARARLGDRLVAAVATLRAWREAPPEVAPGFLEAQFPDEGLLVALDAARAGVAPTAIDLSPRPPRQPRRGAPRG